jgi:DNA mismatch repair protein MutS2
MSFDIQTLEFHQQRQKLSSFAKNKTVQSSLLNLPVLTDEIIIIQSWQYIEDILKLIRIYQGLPLTSNYECLDICLLISKGHLLSLDEAYSMYLSLQDQKMMYQYIKRIDESLTFEFIKNHPIVNISEIYNHFINVMDDEGIIKDDATPQLKFIRKKLKSIDQRYSKSLNESLSQYSAYLNENVIVSRGDALCLAVSDSYKNNIKGILHDISQSKQTVYIEPYQAKSIRDEKILLIEEEKQEILKILKYLTQIITSHLDVLTTQMQTLKIYDTFHAKAQFASHIKGNRPHIEKTSFHLIEARHPALQKDVVPITVYLTKAQHGLFISGSNTGGKTVTLKTIGLLHLMAQAGLFIPASEHSSIMIFEHILADIGDQQSIEHNLSTFSSHLKKHQSMLEVANHRTLLLIDEIGSGTDPQEGVAIAQALLEAYERKEANFVVTTHYQALKQFAIRKNYLNASVSFDQQSLKPTYKIEYGISGRSHAFDIASRLGIEEAIINQAKENYMSLQTDNEKLLETLEQKEKMLNLEKKQLDEVYENVRIHQLKLSEEIQLFEKTRDEKLKKLIDSKEKEVSKKVEAIDQLLKDLKDKKQIPISQYASYKNIQQSFHDVDNTVKKVDFKIGDEVYIESYDQFGLIESIKKNRYFVRVGGFQLEFDQASLSIPERKDIPVKKILTKEKKEKISHTSKPTSNYVFQLDLRGFRFDDVKPALDQAIDKAILSNQPSLRIIHGYGTGAVKKAVYEIIKNHPEIKSHRYGQEGEGLTGATVIYFK